MMLNRSKATYDHYNFKSYVNNTTTCYQLMFTNRHIELPVGPYFRTNTPRLFINNTHVTDKKLHIYSNSIFTVIKVDSGE